MNTKALTAAQLAAHYRKSEALRIFIEQHAEAITLVGRFTHHVRPRHGTAERFQMWRVRIRAAELSRIYAAALLLGGAP
jgi:hypothetical protein